MELAQVALGFGASDLRGPITRKSGLPIYEDEKLKVKGQGMVDLRSIKKREIAALITHAGRLVFVGITTDEVRFRHPLFHRPEGTLLCSRNALSADFARIIALIEEGRIDTRPWITHRATFEELIDVFPSYTQPETGVIKAVVSISE